MTQADPFRLVEIERWMFDEALPFWARNGLDKPGLGFHEQLTLDGRSANVDFKRMRVQARQSYVFHHAAELGWDGPALETAACGIDFITRKGWMDSGGWARRFDAQGNITDTTLDFYEQAFVLFSLGWQAKASGDKTSIEHAHRTIDVIHDRLKLKDRPGFAAEDPQAPFLTQNPHMHYLEAMMVLYEASGDDRFRSEALDVMSLFKTRLFQPGSGVLLEFFSHDWSPAEGVKGRIVEPGHHYEWVWLLARYAKLFKVDRSPSAARLYDHARRHGCDQNGIVFDSILQDGAVNDADHRAWPQTEALKAHIAMAEAGTNTTVDMALTIDTLLDRYLAISPHGLWIDHFDESMHPRVSAVPASTFYHLFLAFAELRRWRNEANDFHSKVLY